MVTVKELIAFLQTQPQDMPVVKRGYESGYDNINFDDIKQLPITRNLGRRYWQGQYNDPDRIEIGKTLKADMVALLIN